MAIYTSSLTGEQLETQSRAVNIKWFGAVGDGVTDDTSAISDWLDYLIANNASGYMPPGNYRQTSALTKSLDSDETLCVLGESMGMVRWMLDTGGNGLNINCAGFGILSGTADGNNQIQFSDITFTTQNGNTGIGINIEGTATQGKPAQGLYVRRCTMRAWNDLNTQGWATQISIDDYSHGVFNDSTFFGDGGRTCTAVKLRATALANSPTTYKFKGCEFVYGDLGIDAEDYIEGIYVSDSNFVSINRGIDYNPVSSTESGLHVCNSHFNTLNDGVKCTNLFDINLSGNLVYTADGYSGFVMGGQAVRYQITGNVFRGSNDNTSLEYGIFASGVGTGSDTGANIVGNTFYRYVGPSAAGILLNVNSDRTHVSGNSFHGCDNKVINNSSTNNVEQVVWQKTHVVTLTGGAKFESFNVTVPADIFDSKPDNVQVTCNINIPSACYYDYANSTNTNLVIYIYRVDGLNLANSQHRFGIVARGS